jgi:hypothetical protein
MDLAGALCGTAYAWLAVLSWQHAAVPLAHFFLAMSLAWASTLAVYLRWPRLHEPFPLQRLLIWGLLFRVIGLLGHPFLDDDYSRYLWDGRIVALSGTPYADRPSDHFTDPTVPHDFQAILDRVNHPHLPTIYGPVCQYAFLISYWLAPGMLFPLKLILLLADLVTIWLLLRLTDPRNAFLYVWCPLVITETSFTAHLDSLGIVFLLGALYALRQGNGRLLGLCSALAVGTRPLAALLVPFFLLKGGRTVFGCFALALLAVYLPFWAYGTMGDIGGVAVFLRDWEFNSTGFALLATWFGHHTARQLWAATFGAWYLYRLWVWYTTDRPTILRGDWIYGVFFLLSPVVNPWYLLWLLPFVAMFPSAWGLAALAAVNLSYAYGLNLGALHLAPYEHPMWVRPLQGGIVMLAGLRDLLTHLHAARLTTGRQATRSPRTPHRYFARQGSKRG